MSASAIVIECDERLHEGGVRTVEDRLATYGFTKEAAAGSDIHFDAYWVRG